MKTPRWTSEAPLARKVSERLASEGWTTYHEVCSGGGMPRADIVATKGEWLWVVEVKLTCSKVLVRQALRWLPYAHRVSVAIPVISGVATDKAVGFRRTRVAELRELGIGVFEIAPGTHQSSRRWAEHGTRHSTDVHPERILRLLHEDQRDADPGSQHGFPTPFQRTCQALVASVQEQPGITVGDAVRSLTSHHYANDRSAISALTRFIRDHGIEGIRYETPSARKTVLYPKATP